jgi:hypothetical protein
MPLFATARVCLVIGIAEGLTLLGRVDLGEANLAEVTQAVPAC